MATDNNVPHQAPVFLLFIISDIPHDGPVICELLDVTCIKVISEVHCVQSEEEGGQHSPLQSSYATDKV